MLLFWDAIFTNSLRYSAYKPKASKRPTEWLFQKDIFKSLDHIVKKKSDQRVTHHHRTSMSGPHCNSKAFRMRFQIGPKYIYSVLTVNIKTWAKKNLQQCHLAAQPLHLRLQRKNDEETSEKWRQKIFLNDVILTWGEGTNVRDDSGKGKWKKFNMEKDIRKIVWRKETLRVGMWGLRNI